MSTPTDAALVFSPVTAYLYRHNEVILPRPYACDVDDSDWLWQGTIDNRLLGHNLRTGELRIIEIPEMEGFVVYSAFGWQEKIFLLFGDTAFYLVYNPTSGKTQRFELPGENVVCWYGTKLPNGKLMVFDRGNRHILIFDTPESSPRIIKSPWPGDQSRGKQHSDGLVYIFAAEPARLIRFDPQAEQFVDMHPLPWPEADITGRHEHDGVLYCADSAGGRLLPLDLKTLHWSEPILTPGYGEVFGFIGNGFIHRGKIYFELSSYMERSTIDPRTNKVRATKERTVDGLPPRFLDRLLCFDPDLKSFDYLVAPEQPDGLAVLCYSWADDEHFAVTGMVPLWESPGVPSTWGGPWIVLQSKAALLDHRQ